MQLYMQLFRKVKRVKYLATYSDGGFVWEALFTMCQLFTKLSKHVAHTFEFTFPREDANNVTAYLQRIRGLSNHA